MDPAPPEWRGREPENRAGEVKSGSWVCPALDGKAVDASCRVLCPPFLPGRPCPQGGARPAPRRCEQRHPSAPSGAPGPTVGPVFEAILSGPHDGAGSRYFLDEGLQDPESDRPLSPEWCEPVGSLPAASSNPLLMETRDL